MAADAVYLPYRTGLPHGKGGYNGKPEATIYDSLRAAQSGGRACRRVKQHPASELICKGWFLPPNTYDCGSFVVNGTAVVGKEAKSLITAENPHEKELIYMKSIFEQMGGTYRQEGDYLIPNLALPEEPEYQIGKYGRMRRSYLKEHRPVLYANLLTSGTLHRHLAEIGQACNERMEIIISDMARQEDVTEALKAADQMEWVRRMNSIRNRAEEIVLTELVYE